jgi:hypothetical protein
VRQALSVTFHLVQARQFLMHVAGSIS